MIGWIAALALLAPPDARLVERLKAVVERQPSNVEARHALAGALIEAGRLGEAEDELRGLMARAPDSAAVCFDLAKLLVETGRVDEGLALLDRAAALAPADPAPVVEAASALLGLGRAADARQRLESIVEPGPPVLGLLAFTRLRLGDARGAREAATRALATDTAAWPLLVLRAIAAVHEQDFAAAAGDVAAAEAIAPKGQANTRYARALLAFAKGEPEPARQAFLEARAMAPAQFDPSAATFDALAFATDDERRFLVWANAHATVGFPLHVAASVTVPKRSACSALTWLTWLITGPEAMAVTAPKAATMRGGRVRVAGAGTDWSQALAAQPVGPGRCDARWSVRPAP